MAVRYSSGFILVTSSIGQLRGCPWGLPSAVSTDTGGPVSDGARGGTGGTTGGTTAGAAPNSARCLVTHSERFSVGRPAPFHISTSASRCGPLISASMRASLISTSATLGSLAGVPTGRGADFSCSLPGAGPGANFTAARSSLLELTSSRIDVAIPFQSRWLGAAGSVPAAGAGPGGGAAGGAPPAPSGDCGDSVMSISPRPSGLGYAVR